MAFPDYHLSHKHRHFNLTVPGAILVSGDRHILTVRKDLPVPVFTLAELLRKPAER